MLYLPSILHHTVLVKAQNPLHQFPRSKSATSWRGHKSVVSFVSCRSPNSITTVCCRVVADLLATSRHVKIVCRVANKSATSWKIHRLRESYGETCVMDFGHW